MSIRRLLLFFLVPLCSSAPAWCCSCALLGGCGAMKPTDTVFVAKVLDLQLIDQHDATNPTFRYRRKDVRLEITETFSNGRHAGEIVHVFTGMGGGDCGYPFVVGETYLIDAYVNKGQLGTSICDATAPANLAVDTLRELRSVIKHDRLPDLSGSITAKDGLYDRSAQQKPLSGIRITLTSALDGTHFSTLTADDGGYAFAVLPSAKYSVQVSLPSTLTLLEASWDRPLEATIPESNGVGAACHLRLTALPSASISGQIVTQDGKPLAATAFVNASIKGHPQAQRNYIGEASSEKNGEFHLNFLPPGDYILTFSIYVPAPRKQWYYPSTYDSSAATSISVADGQTITGLRVVVP